MAIDELLARHGALPIGTLAPHREAVAELQARLTHAGLLDPPADGRFGPVTTWALGAYCRAAGLAFDGALTAAIWDDLSGASAGARFPLADGGPALAARLARAMRGKGHFVSRHPGCRNIVYVEGMDPSGTPNNDVPNRFNDARFVFAADAAGVPQLLGAWEGTTEPGRFWTIFPMNPRGAARIAFGQYKAWSVGTHHPGSAAAHEALVQVRAVTVHRDLNQDFIRPGDRTDTGLFAINQHWGYDNPRDDLGRSSAGCLVGRLKSGHRAFMKRIKEDARYGVNRSYRFMTSILAASDL